MNDLFFLIGGQSWLWYLWLWANLWWNFSRPIHMCKTSPWLGSLLLVAERNRWDNDGIRWRLGNGECVYVGGILLKQSLKKATNHLSLVGFWGSWRSGLDLRFGRSYMLCHVVTCGDMWCPVWKLTHNLKNDPMMFSWNNHNLKT